MTCGTCYYFYFYGLKKWCGHPDHDKEIKKLVGCDKYIAMNDKPLPGHKSEHPDRIIRKYRREK